MFHNADAGVRAAFASALHLSPIDREKTAEAAWGHIAPNVVQFRRRDDGKVMMKWANTEMFSPEEQEVEPNKLPAIR